MEKDYNELIGYYTLDSSEKDRFSRDRAHNIEYVNTMRFIKKYLPEGGHVLDCCAAAGAYAFPLARDGYRVTAGDLIDEHVNLLRDNDRENELEGIYKGDALSLPFSDCEFDAVLCMGALYHLHERADREACILECLRVIKPGGIFIFSYINRNAVYINHFLNRLSDEAYQRNVLKTGANKVFYGMDFDEPDSLTAPCKVERLTNAGVDGLIYPLLERLTKASEEEFLAYMDYHFSTCEQPSIIGHSMHGLWIGRKL